MRYENVKDLKAAKFRRLTGVKHETFLMMVGVLEGAGGSARRRNAIVAVKTQADTR